MSCLNRYREENKTSNVATTTFQEGGSDLGGGIESLYWVDYYIEVVTPAILNIGLLTITVVWHDGTNYRSFTSAGLALSQLGYIQGTVKFAMTGATPEPIPPTFAINLTSLLGTPAYDYHVDIWRNP